ncbi:MAG: N-acetyltransferase [Bacteroidaceae bacterium]|nr:N-acetyltransferase [Bacteroidaceae bacterium]
MSDIIISGVKNRKELRQFARFGYELYKGHPYAVPDLLEDTMDTFDAKKNPAFRFCETELFLARRDGKIVGRVAAIINHRANEKWGAKNVRFGWIDFIDDIKVTRLLMQAVENWGRERGMTHVVGPLGFTDLDPEGMLTDGYDQLGTVFSIYNYPYYPKHMEQLGFQKEQGWVERKVMVPINGHEANMQKYFKIAQLVEQRYGFRIRKFKSKKDILKEGYIEKIFGVVNRAYAKLYEYSELDEYQMKTFADRFLPLLDKRYLSVVENAEGEVIGMGVCVTSLSRAVQKAKSKLFPFGWYHIAKALWFNKNPQILDMLLVGVLPEYHDKGANALIFANIIPEATKDGYEWAETHPQLEENLASQTQWKNLDCVIHKRRAAFGKDL